MPTNRQTDSMILIECLNLIEQQLRLIVFERKGNLVRKEFLAYLPGPWHEVERHFQVARTRIQKEEIDWQYVEGVGLTSPTVAWKRDIMKEAAKQGVISRFLKLANSFLGSLSGGLPVVEFIKEYKDFIEGCLKLRRVFE